MVCLLTGCGKSLDEQVSEGITNAEAAFSDEPIKSNVKEGNVSVYLPEDYVLDATDKEFNYLINSKDDQYILFINENESETSKLNYQLIVDEKKDAIVSLKELEEEKQFGFAAVIEYAEKEYELVVSIGGVKLSTITNGKKIDEKLTNMMEIVRSVEILN